MARTSVKNYKLQIAYTILLTICVPLAYLWLIYAGKVIEVMNPDTVEFSLLFAMFLPIGIYWCAVFVLGIGNIVHGFRLYRQHRDTECLNSMLILKYGLVAFFCVNFIMMALYYFLVTFGAIVASRFFLIIFTPVLLPIWIIAISVTVFFTWLAILPGSFYSIQVLRIGFRERKIGIIGFAGHLILQCIFLTDVLDSMYLATKKFGKGKKSSIVIGAVYILGIVGILWFLAK